MSGIAQSSRPKSPALIPPWLRGGWGTLGIFIILYTLLYLTWTYFHWGGEENISLIGNLAILPPMFLTILVAYKLASQAGLPPHLRQSWFLLGTGMFLFVIGEAIWTYLENVLRIEPFPSLADVFFLGLYPSVLWGLLKFPGASLNRQERRIFWFDLIIVLTTSSMYIGYFLIIPTAAANNNDLLTQLLAMAYPVWSLILLVSVIALLLKLPDENDTRAVLVLVLAGMGFFTASDLAFAYASLAGTYVAGNWIDSGWHIAQVFLVLAALRQSYRGSVPSTKPRWIKWLHRAVRQLPLLVVALGYGLVVYLLVAGDSRGAELLMACALLLTLLVIARQISVPAFADYPVRAKMILTFIVVSVLAVTLVSTSSYLTIRSSLESVAGVSLKTEAEIRSKLLASEMSKQVDLMEGFVLGETVELGMAKASAKYDEFDGDQAAVEVHLQRQNRAWKVALDSEPFVQEVLKNSMSQELTDFCENFPNHSDLLLTDIHGAVISATVRPERYAQGAEVWWQSAYAAGRGAVYISQPTFDPTNQNYQVIMAIPVRADHGQDVIGVLRTTFQLQNILDVLTPTHLDMQAGFNLLLPDGRLIDLKGNTQRFSPENMKHLKEDLEARYTRLDFEGTRQLLSQARLTSSDPRDEEIFQGLNWILIAHEKSSVVVSPLHAAWRTALIATLIILMVTSGIAVLLAQLLIAPISRLTLVASRIAAGDLSAKAQVESQDEIGTLASTFNAMLDALTLARQNVQESEYLYRSLVDHSPDVITVHRGGEILFINPAGAKILGARSAEELKGHQVVDLVPAQDRERVQGEIEQIQKLKGSTPVVEQTMLRVDGTRFESEFRAMPIMYAGEPAIQFVMRDITERRRAEEEIRKLLAEVEHQKGELEVRVEQRTLDLNALNQRLQEELAERQRLVQSLRDHERQLAQAVTLARIAYWEFDLQIAEFTFNDHFYKILRTTAENAGGYAIPAERYIRQFVHPEDANRIRERIRAAHTPSSSTGQLEYRCICGDGQIQHVFLEYQIVFDSQGQATHVFGAHMDITERQQLVQSLRESEEQFRLLFESSPDAILLIDPHDPDVSWSIVDCNEAACRMNGFTRAELLGQSIDLFNATPHLGSEREDYVDLIRQKGTLHYEALHRHKDGHLFSTEVSTSIITFRGRELILGIDRDISERKRTELALQKAKELAEAASRAKSEFLSRMSHELRTPMNAILGFAQLLELSRKEPLTSTQKERVTQIVKGGQHLLDLINEILDISRIEANRLQVSPEPVSVRESIQEVLDLTVPLAVKRQIQIVTKLGKLEEKPFVMADRQRLKQVLLNLLSNAVKYNYEGGSIIISCDLTSSDRWHLSIMDTGPGISQENLSRLFIPFERLDADQPNVEGTGLGLVLAKRLIELMHGQIGVDSILGRGSTFWIELPSAESPVERLRRAGFTGDLSALSADARTILYIEDNAANFELIKQVLGDHSQIELLWATDLKTGLELAWGHRPHLILLDLHLGGTDGAEILRQLKKDRETAGIPVVVVSADATPGQIERLLSWGAHAYLTKPLNVKRFVRLIEELLVQKVA